MSPASNSRFHALVQMLSANHRASSSVSNSWRNRYIGFQSTKTPPRSKTGMRGSDMYASGKTSERLPCHVRSPSAWQLKWARERSAGKAFDLLPHDVKTALF